MGIEISSATSTPIQHFSSTNPKELALSLAISGDVQGAKDFAEKYPEDAELLSQEFSIHNPGLLNALDSHVPAAFGTRSPSEHFSSSPSSGIHTNVVNDPPTTLPPVVVTGTRGPDTGGSGADGGIPGSGNGGGGKRGGAGGVGGGTSPAYGPMLPRVDTPDARQKVVNQVQGILEKMGYKVPAGYTVTYDDAYQFQDASGHVRSSDTYNPTDNETVVYGSTDSAKHVIVITRNAVNPPGGQRNWGVLRDAQGNVSLSGTNPGIVTDAGITPLESTVSTLAHEIYHATDATTNPNFKPGDPAKEPLADTQGYLADRQFMADIAAGK